MTAASAYVPLSDRDEAILLDLARVRLLTGRQVERLHFFDLDPAQARSSSRRRTMRRLSSLSLVTTLKRRVGGARAGSAGLIYTLDAAGQRWVSRRLALEDERGRVRRPWSIGWPFVQHTLDVSELYVRLRELERHSGVVVLAYDTEPDSWHPTITGTLKPDAYAVWTAGGWEHHRWIEVDRATESLPTIRRKLVSYLDAAQGGDLGPRGVFPRVLVTAPTVQRLTALRSVVDRLPSAASDLIEVQVHADVFGAGRPPP